MNLNKLYPAYKKFLIFTILMQIIKICRIFAPKF